jgi:hypothetical protein
MLSLIPISVLVLTILVCLWGMVLVVKTRKPLYYLLLIPLLGIFLFTLNLLVLVVGVSLHGFAP